MSIEAMKQALEALEVMRPACFAETTLKAADTAINALRNRLAQPEQTLTCVCGAVWEGELMVHAPRNRLAQPEQEPVAWMHVQGNYTEPSFRPLMDDEIERGWEQYPLYAAPPQRPWVGLTDEEIIDLIHPLVMADIADEATDYEIARAIESKLKSKNI